MEDCHHRLNSEGVYLWRDLNSRLPLVLFFCFGCAVPDSPMAMVSFHFDWEDWAASRPLVLTPHLFLGTKGSNFLADFLDISASSTSSFHVWALTAPIRVSILSKKLCWHVWSNMSNGMPAGYMSERLQNLSMYFRTDSHPFWTVERSLSIVTSVSSS